MKMSTKNRDLLFILADKGNHHVNWLRLLHSRLELQLLGKTASTFNIQLIISFHFVLVFDYTRKLFSTLYHIQHVMQ